MQVLHRNSVCVRKSLNDSESVTSHFLTPPNKEKEEGGGGGGRKKKR